jgi:hypothetical protein
MKTKSWKQKLGKLALFSAVTALCFSVFTNRLTAQVLYGTIVGTVTDASGAAVPNADVTVDNKLIGITRSFKTDAVGAYSVPNLQAGVYNLKVSAQGFKTVNQTGIDVLANNVIRLDTKLDVGAITDSVTVEASAAVLQTEKADVKSEISQKAVEVLPMNVYRNYQALINLVPGSTPAAFQNSATDTPGRSLTTNVNGTARNMNVTRVDGAVSINVWLPHHTGYTPPSETLETVSVTTGSFDAEQGMAGGASIGVGTRSGTNDLRFAAWEFHNNQRLRARNYFFRPTQQKPRDTLNIYGFRVGGPIIRNKLFYFGHFEATNQRVGGFVGDASVPTMPLRSGDFSSATTIIHDPNTGAADGSGRTQFPGNRIPTNRLNPQAQAVLALLPAPNVAGQLNNFQSAATGIFDRWNYDLKMNYNVSEKFLLWGKYSRFKGLVTGFGAFGELVGPSVVQDPGTGDTVVHVPSIGGTYTASPTFIVDGVFGMNWQDQSVTSVDYGVNYGLERFRIPGTNGPDVRYSGLPQFNITGYSTLGLPSNWMPVFRNDRSYTATGNATWMRGKHEIRFGYDMVYHQLNHFQPGDVANPRGVFNFGGSITARRGFPGEVAPAVGPQNSFADFLLGQFTSAQRGLQFELMTGREWQHGFYVRDRWQVSRRLTLNLGLRMERYPLMTRANTGLEKVELATMNVILGGRGNRPSNPGISVAPLLFGPRIGIAYKISENTVLRTGYGMTFDPLPLSRPLRGFWPLTISQNLVAPVAFNPAGNLTTGLPAFDIPDVSTGVARLPNTSDMRTPGDRINRGYIQSWNLTLERKLPLDVLTSIAYVGTQSTNMLADLNVNTAGPGTEAGNLPYARAFGRRIPLNYWDGMLSSNYHSLQVAFNRSFKNGLFVKGAYTYSRAMNMTDDNGWAGVNFNWGPWFRRNYAQAGFNRPHNWQTAVIYDIPVGESVKNNRFAKGVFGGWQANAVMYRFSGSPFTVTGDATNLLAPGNLQTAYQRKTEVTRIGTFGSFEPYFDPSAFAPVNPLERFGNVGRNSLRGPHVIGMDGGIFRKFSLASWKDRPLNLEFRAEAFNLTNTPRFNNPAAAAQQTNFMWITSTRADSDRQFRFGLKLDF